MSSATTDSPTVAAVPGAVTAWPVRDARPHGEARRSVYEDRPAFDESEEWREEWRAEKLRAAGIGYGWRPLDQFLRDRR